jgi:hypothetical protein
MLDIDDIKRDLNDWLQAITHGKDFLAAQA